MKALHSAPGTGIGYNPGVTYRGGEFLAAGISQGASALAEGIKQFGKNREEAAALDIAFQTRAEPILTDLAKFAAKDGKVDEAVSGLMDKGTKYHTLTSSQKKQVLADVVLLGDRRERERKDAEDKTYRDATLALQKERAAFERGVTASDLFFKTADMLRRNRSENLAEQELKLRKEAQAKEQQRRDGQENKSAQEAAALERFGQDLSRFASHDYQPHSGKGAVRPMSLNEAAIAAFARNPAAFGNPNADNMLAVMARMQPKPPYSPSVQVLDGVKYFMTSPSSAQVIPGADQSRPLPPVTKTITDPKNGVKYSVPMTPAEYKADQLANPLAAEVKKRGDRAAMQTELEQHLAALAKNDERYGFGNLFSRANRVVELKRKLAELGGDGSEGPADAPPSAPAAPPAGGQRTRYNLVNGQLVQE